MVLTESNGKSNIKILVLHVQSLIRLHIANEREAKDFQDGHADTRSNTNDTERFVLFSRNFGAIQRKNTGCVWDQVKNFQLSYMDFKMQKNAGIWRRTDHILNACYFNFVFRLLHHSLMDKWHHCLLLCQFPLYNALRFSSSLLKYLIQKNIWQSFFLILKPESIIENSEQLCFERRQISAKISMIYLPWKLTILSRIIVEKVRQVITDKHASI